MEVQTLNQVKSSSLLFQNGDFKSIHLSLVLKTVLNYGN